MSVLNEERSDLNQHLLFFLLFAVVTPALAAGVGWYQLHRSNVETTEAVLHVERADAAGAGAPLTAEEEAALIEELEAFDMGRWAPEVCGEFGFFAHPEGEPRWLCLNAMQMVWARRLGILALGLAACLGLVLGFSLWRTKRSADNGPGAFRLGTTAIKAFGVPHAIVQWLLCTFLSFWLTALVANLYSPKIVAIVVALGLGAFVMAVRALAKKVESKYLVHGEVVDASSAPDLFDEIHELARQVGTTPPKQVVLGIDDNFFVTESEIWVSPQLQPRGPADLTELSGRTMFVGLGLLEIMGGDEARGVIAHELGHFAGGDTERLARLNVEVQRFDNYARSVAEGFTFGIGSLLRAYEYLFQAARSPFLQEQELAADQTGAAIVGGAAMSAALIKSTAYSAFRSQTEIEMLNAMERHESLSLAEKVRTGFSELLCSDQFRIELGERSTPHPFDSHPPVLMRVQKLGSDLPTKEEFERLADTPLDSLVGSIHSVEAIAGRLWGEYEGAFAEVHEIHLVSRLTPTSAEEVELVKRHYPDVELIDLAETRYQLDFTGVWIGDRRYEFREIRGMNVEKKFLYLRLHTNETVKLKLVRFEDDGAEFAPLLITYFQRHKSAQAHRESGGATES